MAMTSIEEAVTTATQHTESCHDCPMRRNSLPGWLGGSTAEDWRWNLHQDVQFDCHTQLPHQCAGVAIYRRNVCKSVPKGILRLPADRETVFATPMEFMAHHDVFKE